MKANENPFRSSNVERIRYSLEGPELQQLAASALQLRWSCILGPHGTGKTTLLEDLEPLLTARDRPTHWLRLNRDSSPDDRNAAIHGLRSLSSGTVCLFDGAEVLNCWQQFQLRRITRRKHLALIATLHRKRRLAILHHTSPDWPLTETLVRQLSHDHCSPELIEQAKLAFQQSGGNVREVFRACYWQLAQ